MAKKQEMALRERDPVYCITHRGLPFLTLLEFFSHSTPLASSLFQHFEKEYQNLSLKNQIFLSNVLSLHNLKIFLDNQNIHYCWRIAKITED